ncbi:hypothetical protein O6H91_04G057800 [Diphasiastrum complanatum]|uniref:Uncharacterized protein n=1 Tax=Diphasiastrum complanatum TaxID=34168 RepID=A0ACC2DXK3_DIPCM|nr:hypothetical protein O6H91_04G057800 [Diphasiastrum complanatum]
MVIKLFSSGDGGGVQHILVLLVLFVAFGIVVAKWVVEIWWKPKCIKQAFEAQGITGPSYKLLVGNLLDIKKIMSSTMASATDRTLSHKIGQRVDSHFLLWSKVFGDPFLFWWGTEPRLAITKSDWMKEVLLNKGGQYEKIALSVRCVTKDIFGDGLAVADGEKWFELRRLFTPFFYVGKIKAMKGVMETSILQLMDDWHEQVERARTSIVEVDVHKELQKLTAEIISRTVFGSSHREGRRIFELQRIQQRLTMEALVSFKLPGYRYLPTASNRLKQKLKKEVHNTLSRIMKNRLESAQHETGPDKFGDDLLGHMLSANDAMSQYGSKKPSFKLSTEDIIDQCKMFFFAGHETTSLLLTWALMLLASNPDWQQRLQAEVDQVCQNEIPDEEALGQLKYVSNV